MSIPAAINFILFVKSNGLNFQSFRQKRQIKLGGAVLTRFNADSTSINKTNELTELWQKP
jgi:hypothetical protein